MMIGVGTMCRFAEMALPADKQAGSETRRARPLHAQVGMAAAARRGDVLAVGDVM